MVETTICRPKSGKAFTTAVIAAAAGLAMQGSTAAAAVGAAQATTAAGGTLSVAALRSGLAAGILAVIAQAGEPGLSKAQSVIIYLQRPMSFDEQVRQ